MKIDLNTLNILKNFAKINPSIIIKKGSVIRTMSPNKTIMAKASVGTSFPQDFAIYNLDQFLSVLSLFKDPNLEFNDTHVRISGEDGKSSQKYVFSDESTIIKAPEKDIKLPSSDVEFKLTNDDLKSVEKACGILQLPEIVVCGDGDVISLQAADSKNSTSHVYSVAVGSTDRTFKAVFKTENIKIIPGDYSVELCSRGISHFSGSGVEYWIAIESAQSSFN